MARNWIPDPERLADAALQCARMNQTDVYFASPGSGFKRAATMLITLKSIARSRCQESGYADLRRP
jgi:hypothetical protein